MMESLLEHRVRSVLREPMYQNYSGECLLTDVNHSGHVRISIRIRLYFIQAIFALDELTGHSDGSDHNLSLEKSFEFIEQIGRAHV